MNMCLQVKTFLKKCWIVEILIFTNSPTATQTIKYRNRWKKILIKQKHIENHHVAALPQPSSLSQREIKQCIFWFLHLHESWPVGMMGNGTRRAQTLWTNGAETAAWDIKTKSYDNLIAVFALIPASTDNQWSPLLLALFYTTRLFFF